ncbi:MAG: hypothetical protein AAGD05_05035, partial [Bacteroidota bacterium]
IIEEKTIAEIQQEFNNKFSNLKIEFYRTPHQKGEGSLSQEKWPSHLTIGEIRSVPYSGDLSINGHLKVATLEQNFYKQYGLNIQVFRRSGGTWLQTTSTDDWPLSKQNNRNQLVA